MMLKQPRVLTLVDQAFSSLSNFVPGLFAAKALTPRDFGVFALIQVSYIMALGATRSSLSEVAMFISDKGERRQAFLAVLDTITLVSLVGAASAITVLSIVTQTSPLAITAAVAGIAVMLIQDVTRLAAIGQSRPTNAVLNDGLWLVAMAASLTILVVTPVPATAWTISAAWGLSSGAGLIVGARFAGWYRVSPRRALGHLIERRRLAGSFFGEWAVKQGASQIATYAIGLSGGIVTVAGIRAAQILLGPLNVVFTGLQLAATPAAVAMRGSSPLRMRRTLRGLSVVLGVAALAVGLIVALLPYDVLAVIVGDQAQGLSTYVLPIAATLAATGFMTGSHIGLRVLHAGRRLIGARIITSALVLTGGAGAYQITRSAAAGLWGLAVGGLLGVAVWECAFGKELRASALSASASGGTTLGPEPQARRIQIE